MITNPILPGFNPDPAICRQGDMYYIATSTFEWFPGVAIYQSKDLKNWKLYTHPLQDESVLDLRRLEPSRGIWAPCLTWCEADSLFYLVYTIMHSMNSDFFDLDNYVITAQHIEGPWSEPIYLNSSGFDPSIFHDDAGRKWVVNLEWESRINYEHPGIIVIQEYCPNNKKLIGKPKRIWRGGTDRGCVEGPHLYKRNGYYYIMCAEGGTGYGHCVTMGRSKDILGDYESDPCNPILTSTANNFYSRHDSEYLKEYLYNKDVYLQKSGHASWVETPEGEHYIVHLSSRPYLPTIRCILGRETSIQKMYWTEDGWLRLLGGGNLAKKEVEESNLKNHEWEELSTRDNFDYGWNIHYYTPRISPKGWAMVLNESGVLRLRGQESLSSLNRVSFVARKVTGFHMIATTGLVFEPDCFQQSAGLAIYYDYCNYLYLRVYYSESLGEKTLGITKVNRGNRDENKACRIPLEFNKQVYLKVVLKNQKVQFSYGYNEEQFEKIGGEFDVSIYSDEYCGGFTGAFVGLCCVDYQRREKHADFHYFDYKVK